ncbi:MAG: hypothetical protein V9G10_08750 [Candidatus Nanopelagicales bacterium]
MRLAYRIVAWAIGVLVILQAAFIVFAVAGMIGFIDDGGVVDKGLMESDESPFPEVVGFMIHALSGTFLIPLLALILVGVSFGVHFAGAKKWALITLGLVVLQVVLGYGLFGMATLGFLHGLNALLLFGSAVYAGRLAGAEAVIDMRDEQTVVAETG